MSLKKNYQGKNIEMLLAAKTILESLKAHQAELVNVRATWTVQFIDELNQRIDSATQNHIGLDARKDLRSATRNLLDILNPALKDLGFLKVQLESDFKNSELKELLTTLGYNEYYAKAYRKNQESLIMLLYKYRQNLSPEVKAQIMAKGTAEVLLDRLSTYADQLAQANVSQESLKGSSKQTTDEAITEFNEIYALISGICKIAAKYFQDNATLKSKFTYTSIIRTMSATKSTSDKSVVNPVPTV